jgi:hypothetical protein
MSFRASCQHGCICFRDGGGQPERSKRLHGRIHVVRSKGFGVTLVEDVGMNLATSATHQAIWSGVFLVAALQAGLARQEVAAPCDPCELRFDLAADKQQYEVGEPIGLAIRLTNVGTRPVAIQHSSDITGRDDGYRFEVFDESGNRVADPGLRSLSLLGSLGGTYPLAPGSRDSRQLTLNYQVAPLKQGRYRIQGRFNEPSQPGSSRRVPRPVV